MKITYLFLMSMALLLITPFLTAQQVLVNKRWEQSFGSPSDIDWSASVVDAAGNIITTGNTVVSPSSTALLLTKQSDDGTVLWQQTFTITTIGTTPSQNYGVALTTDNSGNIYVAGSCYENELTKHNMLILKYNSAGTKLWHKTYNGGGNDDDAAVGIICNDLGSEVYVTGPSHGTNSLSDYLTLKLNGSTGTTTWENRYNNPTNLHDIPVALTFDNSGKIVVAGGSATNVLNYDLFTLKYNTTGSILDSLRIVNPGPGYDQPSALFKDALGNIYITGSTTSDGINFDMLTAKINSNLDLVWKKNFDVYGGEDRASSICADASGNVYVCGHGSFNQDKKILVAVKYNSSGTELWAKKIGQGLSDAAAAKGILDADGNFLVVGAMKEGNNSYWQTIHLNTDGEIEWSDRLDGLNDNILERPTDITALSSGDIIITGTSGTPSGRTYSTIKYERWIRTTTYQNDGEGRPHVALNELIVRFDNSSVIMSNIDKLDIVFEEPSFFLQSDVVAKLEHKTGYPASRLKLIRIFRHLKTSDTQTTSRLGETIPVPDFWTAFVLVYPEDVNISQQIAALESIFPKVRYAHPTYMLQLAGSAKDLYYFEQASLHPTVLYDSAHINVESAWDRTSGRSFIRVGVFDTGVDWVHDDFNFEGISNVVDGWELSTSTPLYMATDPDPDGHGTACAGIIGALRNNAEPGTIDTLGIAGIAGGDYEQSDLPDFDAGVSLYSLDIFKESAVMGTRWEATLDAIVETSMEVDPAYPYRYGLHVMNNSWSVNLDSIASQVYLDTMQLLSDAVHFANRNKVVFVASRGNQGIDNPNYPAVLDNNWVLNIGASDEDGHYAPFASFGSNVDVVAPGVGEVIKTLDSGGGYINFSGTSAAAPHVAGSAALLLSQFNDPFPSIDNLAPEDIERLMEKTAADIDFGSGATPGYDDYTGWGKLNIGLAMDTAFQCPVRHSFSEFDPDGAVYAIAQTGAGQAVYLTEPVHTSAGLNFMEGNYSADVYQVTATVDHDFGLDPGSVIIDGWPLHSCSDLMRTDFSGAYLIPHENIRLDVYNNTTATLTGYAFELFQGGVSQGWIPFDPNVTTPRFAYSLQVCGNTFPVEVEDNTKGEVKLYPNPAGDELNIELAKGSDFQIRAMDIFDIQGRLVSQPSTNNGISQRINTASLPAGMYLLRLYTNKGVIATKFVKI